jgi:hypothetical protein
LFAFWGKTRRLFLRELAPGDGTVVLGAYSLPYSFHHLAGHAGFHGQNIHGHLARRRILRRAAPGWSRFLVSFSAIYAGAMVLRYVLTMALHPDQRWLGGTIPIFFHFVLAGFFLRWGISILRG